MAYRSFPLKRNIVLFFFFNKNLYKITFVEMISIGADFLRLVHFEMQTLDIAAFNALPNCSIAAYSMRVRN